MTDEELKQLVASNAQAIQALSRDVSRLVEVQQEDRITFRDAILKLTQVQEGIVNLLTAIDEDRPTVLRKLTAIENKVDRLLEKEQ